MYSEARQLFLEPEVTNPDDIEVNFSCIPSRTVIVQKFVTAMKEEVANRKYHLII